MEKKEISMEVRLLIAFVLMGLVVVGTQLFYKPPPAALNTNKDKATAPVAEPVKPANPPEQPAPARPAAAVEIPGQIQAEKEETVTIETDLYRVVFSNRGAVVRNWILKRYKDHTGKQLELVNQKALGKAPAPFALSFKTPPQTDPNSELFRVSQDGLNLEFEFSDGRADTKRTFRFAQNSYLVQVTSQVTANGVLAPHSLEWRGGFGDSTIPNAGST
jgi:YidC/Oxa1 family membrane protein insertase